MSVLEEKRGAGIFLAHEANGTISRETVTIAEGEGILEAGTLLAKLSDGDYVALDLEGEHGEDAVAGILYSRVDATADDVVAVAIVRHAEVNKAELLYPTEDAGEIAAIDAALLALQIKPVA